MASNAVLEKDLSVDDNVVPHTIEDTDDRDYLMKRKTASHGKGESSVEKSDSLQLKDLSLHNLKVMQHEHMNKLREMRHLVKSKAKDNMSATVQNVHEELTHKLSCVNAIIEEKEAIEYIANGILIFCIYQRI